MSITVLLEASPRRASDGVVQTLRMVWNARSRADFFGSQWLPVLQLPPSFETDIGFDGSNFGQGATPNVGAMQIILNSVTAAWPGLIWKNAALTIKAAPWPKGGLPVDAADGDFALVTNARAASISASDGLLTLVVLDAGEVLRRPVQPVLFGTSGIALLDGTDAKDHFGSPVPVGWGVLSKIKGRLVDRTNLIYCFLGRAATAAGGFFDGGAPFTLGVARANLAALQANTPADGTVDYCLNAAGLVLARPWAKPVYPFTTDLTAGSTQAADIANTIVTSRTALTFGAGVVAAFNGIQSAPCGCYVDDSATIAEQLDRLFAGLGSFWRLTRAGTLDIKRIGFAGVAAVTFGSWQVAKIERRGTILPTGRRTLGYGHNNTVHGENDIAKLLTENIEIDYSAVTGATKPADNATKTSALPAPPDFATEGTEWIDTSDTNKRYFLSADLTIGGVSPTYGGVAPLYWLPVSHGDFTADQPSVSRLSPQTGQALPNFTTTAGGVLTSSVASGEARNGDVIWFGRTLSAVPRVFFGSGGIAPTAGQNIVISSEGLSTTGFVMRAVSQSFSGAATVTDTGAVAGGTDEPDFVIDRSGSVEPADGRYAFTYRVAVANIGGAEPENGYVEIGIFVRQSGEWSQCGTAVHTATGDYRTTATPGPVDHGTGAEFGVALIDFYVRGSTLTAFTSVEYVTATVSETSLTPTGASPIPWRAEL